MRSLDDLRQVAAAVGMVRNILFDLQVNESGDRILNKWEYQGIDALCSLISGELEAAHDQEFDELLAFINKEASSRVEVLRQEYHGARHRALKEAGLE